MYKLKHTKWLWTFGNITPAIAAATLMCIHIRNLGILGTEYPNPVHTVAS